jgi:hypothetical protein
MSDKPFYQSSNGDTWFLVPDPATGELAVKHIANPASGGQISYIDPESFLAGGNGPEHQALRQLAASEQQMTTMLIAYDIHPASGPKYDVLTEAIQSLGSWWHHLETVWIVRSGKTPEELRDHLQRLIGPDDQLLIVDVTSARAGWAGLNEAGGTWLRENVASKLTG